MKIITFKNQEPVTDFAPVYDYSMCEVFLDNIDNNALSDLIMTKEKEIIEQTLPVDSSSPDGYTGLGINSLTSRYTRFNVMKWRNPCVVDLKNAIYESYLKFLEYHQVKRRKVWISCWANVLRSGESIQPHIHCVDEYTYLSGNYVVQAETTKTFYLNPINQINEPATYEVVNTPGNLVIFQSNIPHFTDIHTSNEPRITIAFDLIVDEMDTTVNTVLFDGE